MTGTDRDGYDSYLRSESDRMAIFSRQHHMEKLDRECHAKWFPEESKGETSNSVLEELRHGHASISSRELNDGSSNSLLDSCKASMEEARLSIKHKEEEISMLKWEKEDYALMSEERTSENLSKD